MRDGKLKITFEAGEIVVVSVNAGLDLAYQRLFESARRQLRQPEPPIEAGIQLIVFGCFWLEALSNEAVRDLIRATTKPSIAAEAVWETIKRAPLHSKLAIVSAFRRVSDPDHSGRITRDLTQLFDLRNRLAHFKDEDVPIAGRLTVDELWAQFEQFPDADLLAQLRPPAADRWAETILDATAWVTEIREQYFPSTSHSASDPTDTEAS
jgi:hypothetical protein